MRSQARPVPIQSRFARGRANSSFLLCVQQPQPYEELTDDGFGVSLIAIFGLAVFSITFAANTSDRGNDQGGRG